MEPIERWVVKLDFVGANAGVRPVGKEETGAVISYFKGNPEEWKTGLPAYSKVVYLDLWPGIDLVFTGTSGRMKYEFIVHPGADPSAIRLACRGVEAVKIAADGRLVISTPVGGFEDDVPVAWQEVDGERANVSVSYVLEEGAGEKDAGLVSGGGGDDGVMESELDSRSHVYRFAVGEYDQRRPLVLDPAFIIYCGYIGGLDWDAGYGRAVDGSGNAYVTGYTDSDQASFPVIYGPDLSYNGAYDAFVAKVSAGFLEVTPTTGFNSSGPIGGPFSPSSQTYTLQNIGFTSINWTATKTVDWISLDNTSGTLSADSSTTVTVSINSNANSLKASSKP